MHDELTRLPPAETPAEEPLDALVALHRARHDLAVSDAALEISAAARDDRNDDVGLLLLLNRGIVLLMNGRLDEADGELSRAHSVAARSGNAYATLRADAYRTALVAARGRFRRAWKLAHETMRHGMEAAPIGTPEFAGTMLLAAHSARQLLDGAASRRLAEQAAALMDGAADLDTLLSLRALRAVLDVEEGGPRSRAAVRSAPRGRSPPDYRCRPR